MDVDEVVQNWSDIESDDSEEFSEECEGSGESEEIEESGVSSSEEEEGEGAATAHDSWMEVAGLLK